MTGKFKFFGKKTDKGNNQQDKLFFQQTQNTPNPQCSPNQNQSYKNFSQNNAYPPQKQNPYANAQWYANNYNANQWQQLPQNNPLKTFVPYVCPKCGANLIVESGIDTFFCQYCGSKILLQNETNLKTRLGMKKIEHAEKMVDKVVGYFDRRREQKAIEEEKKRKENNRDLRIILLISIAIMIGIFLSLNNKSKESKAQEAELQTMVEQIQIDITNGDFDAAYVKASALNYTSGYSTTVEKKWDDTRESLITLINQLRNVENPNGNMTDKQQSKEKESIISPTVTPTPTVMRLPTITQAPTKHTSTPDAVTAKSGSKGHIEKFVLPVNNNYSKMYAREERFFTVWAYPNGIKMNDFTVNCKGKYINCEDIQLSDKADYTEISFKVVVKPSLLEKSTRQGATVSVESTTGDVSLDGFKILLETISISDAEPLTLKINEPQIATFKVVPAALHLEDLKIGMNAYISNLKAEIIDSEIDEIHNCQYVHVRITANGKHNGLSSSSFNLNDKYQIKGGTCKLTIVD